MQESNQNTTLQILNILLLIRTAISYFEPMQDFRKSILNYLKKNPAIRAKIKQLAKHFNIPGDGYPEFRDTVKTLEREGALQRFPGHSYGISGAANSVTIQGELDMHPRGFAFVHSDDGQKIYIDAENLASAAHGDRVELALHRPRKGDRNREGHVLRVLRREKTIFLCRVRLKDNECTAQPLIHHLNTDIIIRDMNGMKPADGEHVLAEITEWSTRGPHYGRIHAHVGRDSVPEFDAVLVANKYNLPDSFSPETLQQVEALDSRISEEPERKDLRELVCVTIDPEDARDFDDALSIERDEAGNFRLGVHIADVSHYVPFNSPLDRDALKRGTSVYFTDFVLHMLPEKLSTDLCSLMPDTDRFTMSIFMLVDKEGKTLDYSITPSLICSSKRFSYEEVQEVLDAKEGPFYKELSQLSRLANILQKKRHSEGSIDFDLPEPVYKLDEKGVPESIRVKERLWSHHIVEECMLLANKNVANFARTRGSNVPFIYRIHDIPEADDIYEWFALMDAFGVQDSFFGLPITSAKFQKALEKVLKQNKSSYVMRTALRTMTKAKYSVKPVGHFGLAFEDYTHFTSPIRRYPDLMVHRLLKYYLKNKQLDPELKKQLNPIAKSCSAAELRALEAEREYHKIKQMRYISEHVGSEFDGTISGVAQHGFWVELEDCFVEGFVSKDTLPNDIWDYDKRQHMLKGFRSKLQFQMGHRVRVRVIRADIKNARADFIPADPGNLLAKQGRG